MQIKNIRDWARDGLEGYPNLNFVYEQNGKILGAISAISIKNKKVEINNIAVLKKNRNRTISTKLMNKLIRDLAKV